ncbi:MAG: hypothetical protein ACOYXW_04965, partial [Actinomycetota bacterium]
MTGLLVSAGEGLDPNSVSPGLIGFLATFGVVVATILLFVNMSRRLRRLRYREEQEAARGEPITSGATDDEASTSEVALAVNEAIGRLPTRCR